MPRKFKMLVFAKTQVEGIHYFKNAPTGVEFLRERHRHMFHVKAYWHVSHVNRDKEFILLKRKLTDFVKDLFHNEHPATMSCEFIACSVIDHLHADKVEVNEDGENGAVVHKVDY